MKMCRSIIALCGFTLMISGASADVSAENPQLPYVPGLTLHLDASDIDAISLVDGRVVEWRASNNANIVFTPAENHAAEGDYAPYWVSGAANQVRPVNGRPVVSFNGVSSLTSNSPDALAMTNNIAGLTFFGVGWNTGGGAQTFLRIRGGSGVVRVFFYRGTNDHRVGGRRLDQDTNQTLTSPSGSRLFEEWGIDSAIVDYANANAFMHLHGELIASTDSWQTPGLVSPTNAIEMSVGSDNRSPARGQLWDGDIAEVLFFDRVLSPEEFHAVGNYLAEKYALSWPEPEQEKIQLTIRGPARQLSFNTVENRDYLIYGRDENGEDWKRVTEEPLAGTGGILALPVPVSVPADTIRVVEWTHEQLGGATPAALPEIEGLRLHLDAGKSDTLLLDGIHVVEWRNAVDQSMVFSQPESDRRPVHLTGMVNGQPTLIFEGGRFLETTSPSALGLTNDVGALTFFGVGWNRGGGAQNFMRISQGGASSATATRAMFYRATNDHRAIGGPVDGGATRTLIGGPRLNQEWGIDSSVLNFGESEGLLFINGREVAVDLSFLEPGRTSPTDAHRFRIAANTADTAAQLWDGDISEMLLFDRALSLEERNTVGMYLSGKYGIPYRLTHEEEIDFVVDEGVELEFTTELANQYRIEATEDLSYPWVPLGEVIEGIGVNERIFVPFEGSVSGFFRVLRVN